MNQQCPALLAATAKTITFAESTHEVILSNPATKVVYLKFNWAVGDTEVSATNFDAFIPAGLEWRLVRNTDAPHLANVRVICADAISLGVMSW